jgi:phospholipase C
MIAARPAQWRCIVVATIMAGTVAASTRAAGAVEQPDTGIAKIDHVVVSVQENRSFDHPATNTRASARIRPTA